MIEGGSEVLIFVMFVICNLNDEVLILEFFYLNYKSFLDIVGVKIIFILIDIKNDFVLFKKEEI